MSSIFLVDEVDDQSLEIEVADNQGKEDIQDPEKAENEAKVINISSENTDLPESSLKNDDEVAVTESPEQTEEPEPEVIEPKTEPETSEQSPEREPEVVGEAEEETAKLEEMEVDSGEAEAEAGSDVEKESGGEPLKSMLLARAKAFAGLSENGENLMPCFHRNPSISFSPKSGFKLPNFSCSNYDAE